MTERLKYIKDFFWSKQHVIYRKDFADESQPGNHQQCNKAQRILGCAKDDVNQGSLTFRIGARLVALLNAETAIVLPFEKIAFTRTIAKTPELLTDKDWEEARKQNLHIPFSGTSNIAPGYEEVIINGLDHYLNILDNKPDNLTAEQKEFVAVVKANINALINLSDRYQQEAKNKGNTVVAELLTKVPRKGAETFHEALQMFRILHFTLWLEGNIHNTIGRFDQYMYPFFKKDIDSGVLTEEAAYELLVEFFLTFNRDSDLYFGIQQGDNGQSMVLGGVDANGNCAFNRLSELCLKASKELKMIDPKINLRVNKNTPMWVYELGTELTREGLGFPQYSNDDVVIPGLVALGYDLEDARNYVVAACWEFIIPRYGLEVPNFNALHYTRAVNNAFKKHLAVCETFDQFMAHVKKEIESECDTMIKRTENITWIPGPFMSLFMDGCIENAQDASKGLKYNNYGFHGSGVSTAIDSLAAIRQLIFKEKSTAAQEYVQAVDNNFVGYEELLDKLRNQMPKMGNNEDDVDSLAVTIMAWYGDYLAKFRNDRGGRFRAGTGSAQAYLSVQSIGASPDGRRADEPYGANYAPSLFAKIDGPLSVIQSFTKPDFTKTINGGPLTMEFHDSLFSDADCIQKVASLVALFIKRGGHQIQLNAINRETLEKAQKNPEKYANLIVRVWGWSGYFVQLEKQWQDHIISRQAYT